MLWPRRLVSDLSTHSPSNKPPLRIGLLLDSPWLSAAANVIYDLRRSDFVRLELVICNPQNGRTSNTSALLGCEVPRKRGSSTLAWRINEKFDARVARADIDSLIVQDCESTLKNVDCLMVADQVSEGGQLTSEVMAAIHAKDLDVLLQFGFTANDDALFHVAKFGTWFLYLGDCAYYRGGPPYFWELYEQNPLSGLTLVMNDDLGKRHVLAKAFFSTEPGVSVLRNTIRPLGGFSQIVMQKLWELHAYGWDFVTHRIVPSKPYIGKRKKYQTPTGPELFRWLVPRVTARLYKRVKWAVTGSKAVLQWRIAIRTGGRHIYHSDGKPELDGFRWLEPAKGHFYADPFIIDLHGHHWLFFEDYEYQRRRGRIVCAEVSTSGDIGEIQTALEANYHLSYPYVFAVNGSLHMIPESGDEGVVRLYRCVRFPDRWAPIADLFNGPAFDTSIYYHDNLWWFFTTLQDPRGHGVALYLFFSENLTGEWQYHPANPISYDVRNARCAGLVCKSEDKLIRPSQRGVTRYGYSFSLNEVVRLTPRDYEERPILTVEPHLLGNLMAAHTYNRDGWIEVIDGQRLTDLSQL